MSQAKVTQYTNDLKTQTAVAAIAAAFANPTTTHCTKCGVALSDHDDDAAGHSFNLTRLADAAIPIPAKCTAEEFHRRMSRERRD